MRSCLGVISESSAKAYLLLAAALFAAAVPAGAQCTDNCEKGYVACENQVSAGYQACYKAAQTQLSQCQADAYVEEHECEMDCPPNNAGNCIQNCQWEQTQELAACQYAFNQQAASCQNIRDSGDASCASAEADCMNNCEDAADRSETAPSASSGQACVMSRG